jgi:hypothetical protein
MPLYKESDKLTIEMVHSMAGGTIDDRGVGYVLAVMYQDCPNVDKDKQKDVCEFLQRKDEGEHVIRY